MAGADFDGPRMPAAADASPVEWLCVAIAVASTKARGEIASRESSPARPRVSDQQSRPQIEIDPAAPRTNGKKPLLLPGPRHEVTFARVARMVGRALLLHCPRCGGGGILHHWLRPREQCPRCGIRLDRGERDHWLGGYAVNLVASELIWAAMMVTVLIVTWPSVPWDFLTYGGAALMIALPFFFFPFSRTIWLALDLAFRHDRDADTGVRDVTQKAPGS